MEHRIHFRAVYRCSICIFFSFPNTAHLALIIVYRVNKAAPKRQRDGWMEREREAHACTETTMRRRGDAGMNNRLVRGNVRSRAGINQSLAGGRWRESGVERRLIRRGCCYPPSRERGKVACCLLQRVLDLYPLQGRLPALHSAGG